MEKLLKIKEVTKAFGGLKAVSKYNLELGKGEIRGIIGPNGAGKTTVFNLITGVYQPDSGQIHLDGENITGHQPDTIARKGIARTFQNIRLFGEMTVWDNVKMAFHARTGYNFWGALLHSASFKKEEKRIGEESLEFLDYLGLAERRNELAKNLPYGEQRRLEIARALATRPKILLLDEPAAGMNPKEVEDLIGLIQKIHNDFPLSILLIDHQMPVVTELCHIIQVINFGQLIAEGIPSQVINNPLVLRAYLGEEEAIA